MAGGSSRADSGKKKARIEIIPLIDVIFFLLATFVLFTLSLDKIESIPVQLPVSQPTTVSKPDDDMVTIQVSDAGSYYWGQGGSHEPISASEITPRLDQYKRMTQTPKILLTCDDHARFKDAIFVLDQVRKAGIQQFSVDTTGAHTTGR